MWRPSSSEQKNTIPAHLSNNPVLPVHWMEPPMSKRKLFLSFAHPLLLPHLLWNSSSLPPMKHVLLFIKGGWMHLCLAIAPATQPDVSACLASTRIVSGSKNCASLKLSKFPTTHFLASSREKKETEEVSCGLWNKCTRVFIPNENTVKCHEDPNDQTSQLCWFF